MKTFEQINPSIAHISQVLEDDTTIYFQELNEAGDDWEEAATTAEYQNYLNSL